MPTIDYNSATNSIESLEAQLIDSLGGDTNVDRRTVLGGLGIAGSAAVGFGGTRASASPEHEDKHGNFGAVGNTEIWISTPTSS